MHDLYYSDVQYTHSSLTHWKIHGNDTEETKQQHGSHSSSWEVAWNAWIGIFHTWLYFNIIIQPLCIPSTFLFYFSSFCCLTFCAEIKFESKLALHVISPFKPWWRFCSTLPAKRRTTKSTAQATRPFRKTFICFLLLSSPCEYFTSRFRKKQVWAQFTVILY